MSAEALLSIVLLATVIWSVRFLLPKAIREHDTFAIVCAALTALLAFIGWLFLGIGTRSAPL